MTIAWLGRALPGNHPGGAPIAAERAGRGGPGPPVDGHADPKESRMIGLGVAAKTTFDSGGRRKAASVASTSSRDGQARGEQDERAAVPT